MIDNSIKTGRVIAALLCLLLATGAAARAGTAKVDGMVVDQDENPIRDAVVTVRGTDGSEVSETTNRRGKFGLTIKDFAGEYTIHVVAEGFAPFDGPLALEEGRTTDITIPLLSQELAEQQRAQIAALEARNKAARIYNDGAKLFNEGDLDGAAELFRQAVEEEEELAIAWGGLGRIYLEQEKYAEAAAALERFDEYNPDQEVALLMLYDSYSGMGEEEKAATLMERLVSEFPGAGVGARIFNLGVDAMKSQDLAAAREHFENVLRIHPEFYQAHINLAHIHRAFGEWEKVLQDVDAFLAAEPDHPRSLALRYQALEELGRAEEAEQALANLREAQPGEAAQIFHEQGVQLFNAGETEGALEAFEAALKIDPTHARAHYRAGLCYVSLSDNAKAREHFEKFIEMAPDDPEAATAREMLAYL